jgi:hypothetical protein
MMDVPDNAMPESRYKSGFRFSYSGQIDTAAAASEDITIAVVNPDIDVLESAFRTDFLEGKYRPVGKGVSASMGVDVQNIMVGKGMTVKGPFAHKGDVTYSEKKNSHLMLIPEIFVEVQIKYIPVEKADGTMSEPEEFLIGGKQSDEKAWASRTFEMRVKGYFSFRLQEPMSGETMWIKKIPLEEVVRRGQEVIEAQPDYNYGYYTVTNKVLVDQSNDTLADIMADYYQMVLTKFRKHIDLDELYDLKEKTAEIRKRKRY